MALQRILKQYGNEIALGKDIHVLRHFSVFIVVSEGRVIYVSDPDMRYCPLANVLYPGLRKLEGQDLNALKAQIQQTMETKIRTLGQFTNHRQIIDSKISIPYGASEMMMYALRKKTVDVAVLVCEGAGTVVTDNPDVVQGIGSRMNGLFWTSPIQTIQERLKQQRCHLVSDQARIDQMKGIEQAVRLGHKRIAVTVNGFRGENLKEIRSREAQYKVCITIFVICTTGVADKRIDEIKNYADLVWSCGSRKMREQVGQNAFLQFSRAIPVFVLTEKGMDVAKAYFEAPGCVNHFSKTRQFLVCDDCEGKKVKVGNFSTRLCVTKLPSLGKRSPIFHACRAAAWPKPRAGKEAVCK